MNFLFIPDAYWVIIIHNQYKRGNWGVIEELCYVQDENKSKKGLGEIYEVGPFISTFFEDGLCSKVLQQILFLCVLEI
jgi:hypothetical protein